MGNELKFVLTSLCGLPEKEKCFVRKMLDDFRKMGIKSVRDETLDVNYPVKSPINPYNEIKKSYLDSPPELEKISTDSVDKPNMASEIGSIHLTMKNAQYKLQDGLIITSAANFNESLLASGLTTVVYDKNLGSGLPYGFDLIVDSFEDIDIDFLIRIFKHKNKIPCMIAETKRTVIRELCEKDIDEVIKISREEHIIRFVEDGREPEEEQIEKLLAYIDNIYSFYDYGIWGIFDRADGSLIGLISLDFLADAEEARYETGFFIRKERLGQGFATEAIEMVVNYAKNKLSASELIAITDYENMTARSLLEKCGFTVAGRNDKMIYVKQLEN